MASNLYADSPIPPLACDELIASAVRAATEAGEPVSRLRLTRLVKEAQGCRTSEAHEVVKDYCARHGVVVADPPAKPWQMALGCTFLLLLPILLAGFIYGIVAGVPHHGTPTAAPAWMGAVKYGWAALLTFFLVRDLRGDGLRRSLTVLRQLRPGLVAQNLLVVLVTIGCAFLLDWLCPWLDRSWLYLFPLNGGHATNLNLLPATIKYFGLFFLILLALNLPALARAEELKYRKGTRDWRDALGRSVRFGLAHCWIGIPIYAGLALTVGGLWFTWQYFRGGVERRTLHHTTYNLTLVTVLFALLLLRLA
ncbi:MAG: hypothetical protein JO250_21250 [Armatimonadetes bacterium]|nr:hypothetical protein [Armatimonadota bacterium]